jgi:hypothetical protein
MIWLLLAGCGTPEAAPGSTVLAPDDVSALWDESYAEADEIGGLFPMEALVLGPDGESLAGVRVSVLSGWDGALVLDREATGPRRLLDARSGESYALGACGESAGAGCNWIEGETNADGTFRFNVFLDVAPDSGAKVPVFIAAGADVVSVEITLDTAVVVH